MRDYPDASALEVLYIIIICLSIKLILCIPQTPLFIAFADAKKFWREFLEARLGTFKRAARERLPNVSFSLQNKRSA